MIGPDPERQARMAAEMAKDVDASLEQIERETSAFMARLVRRWAIRWAVLFAILFVLTRLVDWLDWLWWIAVPVAVLSLAIPLLLRRFLARRLARARGRMSGFGAGPTIDGSWREGADEPPPSPGEPGGVIIDQRPDDRPADRQGDDRL